MKRKRDKQKKDAEGALGALFEAIAGEDDEVFDDIVAAVNRRALLEAAAGRLRAGYRPGDFLIYETFFRRLGVVPIRAELESIALDRALSPESRMTALEALVDRDSAEMPPPIEQRLPREELLELTAARLRELVLLCLESASMSEGIATMLAAAPSAAEAHELFAKFELLRQEHAVPAVAVYDAALSVEKTRPLHREMLNAVVSDGTIAAKRLIAELFELQGAPEDALLDDAAARLSQAQARPGALAAGTARISSWLEDGILLAIERPSRNGMILTVVLHFGAGNRTGLVAWRRPSDVALFESVEMAQISLEEAAHVVQQAFPTESDLGDDDVLRAAVMMALHVRHLLPPPALPPAAPAVSTARVRELLARPAYDWFFMPVELDAAELLPPRPEDDVQRWSARALERLAAQMGPELAERCRFMSRWHLARGEEEDAALLARLAIDAQSSFTTSALPAVMLERTLAAQSDAEEEEEEEPDLENVLSERARRDLLRVVGQQIAHNDPPAVGAAFRRLVARGASEKEAREELAAALAASALEGASGSEPDDLLGSYIRRAQALGK